MMPATRWMVGRWWRAVAVDVDAESAAAEGMALMRVRRIGVRWSANDSLRSNELGVPVGGYGQV
jgi:hypothetical protein